MPEYIKLGSQVLVETKWFNGKENTIFVQKAKEVINKLLISMTSTIHNDLLKDLHEHITEGYLGYLTYKAKYEDERESRDY